MAKAERALFSTHPAGWRNEMMNGQVVVKLDCLLVRVRNLLTSFELILVDTWLTSRGQNNASYLSKHTNKLTSACFESLHLQWNGTNTRLELVMDRSGKSKSEDVGATDGIIFVMLLMLLSLTKFSKSPHLARKFGRSTLVLYSVWPDEQQH